MVLAFLPAELSTPEPGTQTVLDRSLDLMLALGCGPGSKQPNATLPGWYAALDDPVAGPAIRAIHAEPSRTWSVAELARLGRVSRAAFAKRFNEVVGQAPMSYLTNWRMTLAAQALANTRATIAAVADHVGFKRVRIRDRISPTVRQAPGTLAILARLALPTLGRQPIAPSPSETGPMAGTRFQRVGGLSLERHELLCRERSRRRARQTHATALPPLGPGAAELLGGGPPLRRSYNGPPDTD